MTPPRVPERAATNSRDKNLANNSSGTKMTAPANVPLRVERTRSKIGKNRTWVDSGEHHKASNLRPRRSAVGAVELLSNFIAEEIWQARA